MITLNSFDFGIDGEKKLTMTMTTINKTINKSIINFVIVILIYVIIYGILDSLIDWICWIFGNRGTPAISFDIIVLNSFDLSIDGKKKMFRIIRIIKNTSSKTNGK